MYSPFCQFAPSPQQKVSHGRPRHAADVEGRQNGIDRDLVGFLARYKRVPITYAGGVSDYGDIELISYLSDNNMDFTVGSCLDLFGGNLSYERIVKRITTR
ncbi:HisA/HisF-related TIM barrel protein [Pseudobutyrivibrio sp.]